MARPLFVDTREFLGDHLGRIFGLFDTLEGGRGGGGVSGAVKDST